MLQRCGKVLLLLLIAAATLEGALTARALLNGLRPAAPVTSNARLKILAIGDSILGVEGAPHSLVGKIRDQLPGYEVFNASLPGNRLEEVRGRIGDLLSSYRPNYVILMLGKNASERLAPPPTRVELLSYWLSEHSRLWRLGTLFYQQATPTLTYLSSLGQGAPMTKKIDLPAGLPDAVARSMRLGKQGWSSGDFPTARSYFENAVSFLRKENESGRYPEVASLAHAFLARIAVFQGSRERYARELQEARLTLGSSSESDERKQLVFEAYINLSTANLDYGDLPGSLFMAQSALRMFPRSALANERMGWAYRAVEDWGLARKYFAAAFREDSEKEILVKMIYECVKSDQKNQRQAIEEADSLLRELLPRAARKDAVLLQLAGIEALRGNTTQSEAYLTEAARLTPDNRDVFKARLAGMRLREDYKSLDEEFAQMSPSANVRLTAKAVKNYREILKEILAHGAVPVVLEYPGERPERLRAVLTGELSEVKLIATREYLLHRPNGVHVHELLEDDFEHLTENGARWVASNLAHDLKTNFGLATAPAKN